MKEKLYKFIQREECQNLIDLQLCGITLPYKNYSITRPKSKISCIEFIDRGTGSVFVGKEKFCPSEGDSYFLQTGFDQTYYSDALNPWKKYFINISGPLLRSMTEGYGLENRFYYPGLNIKNELLRIIELAKNKNCECTKEVISVLNEIFLKMHLFTLGTAQKSTAVEIKNYLNTKIEFNFKIADLCKFVNKSESQVIKIFKRIFSHGYYSPNVQNQIKRLCATCIAVENQQIK